MTFGARLRKARRDMGLTQNQLARELDIQPFNISRWETGRVKSPERGTIVKLARALRCDAGWLLTGEHPVDAGVDPEPDYPALGEFLETDLGKTATPEEVEALRAWRFSTGRPNVGLYEMALLAVRRHLDL